MDKHNDTISPNVCVIPEDDSIADFKSPKQSSITKVTESNNSQRRKAAGKLKNPAKNKKESNKQCSERKRNLQNAQPSIESSFFKAKSSSSNEEIPDVEVGVICPLCFKTFKDCDSRILHMKICAFRNNISTKRLIEVIELQNRQEDERTSLGLLAGPAVQRKKKPMVSSREVLHEEGDFELALALSKSLQEAQDLNTINEIERLPQVSDLFLTGESESANQAKKGTRLERFGFANSKPPVVRPRKRKKNEITVLQIRTEEERNRILTERISEILMGNESITQNQKAEIKCNVIKKEIHLQSPLLQEIYKEKELWNKAKLTRNQKCFYVPSLLEYISPKQNQIIDVDLDFPDQYSLELNEYKKEEICNIEKVREVSSTDISESCKNCKDKQFINTVISNWSSILNDSSASDIIIFVKNDKHVWAHRLVFYVQCSNVLLDVTPNDTSEFSMIKEKINWTDISYDIALAFLEFIYCGIIKNYAHVLENVANFTTLRKLARKYKMKELFTFLQRKEVELKAEKSEENKVEILVTKETDNLNLTNDNIHDVLNNSKDAKLLDENDKFSKNDVKECTTRQSQFVKTELTNDTDPKELLAEGIELSEISILQATNLSPDLFDESNTSRKSIETKNKTKYSIDEIDVKEREIVDQFSMLGSNKKSNKKSEEAITYESIEETADTLTNITYVTTPKSSRYSNSENTRNNISVFIEKCRRENAKSISDLDSEISMILTPVKPIRNPFHIDQCDSSCTITKTGVKDKHVLSVLDCQEDSLKDVETSIAENDIDVHIDLNKSESDIRSKSNIEEKCKSESDSSEDSIMNNETNFENEGIHSISKKSLHESTQSSADTESEEDATCSNFDTTGIDISMYSKYKKEHKDNSIIKYRSFVKTHILPSNAKSCKLDENKENDNSDSDIVLLSDTDTEAELSITKEVQPEKKKLSFNSKDCEQTPQHELHNSTNEPLTDDRNNYSSTDIMSSTSTIKNTIKNTKRNNLSVLKYNKSESYIDLKTTREHSFSSNVNERNSIASPVLISSSPEFDYDNLSAYKCDEIKGDKNVSRCPNFDDIFEKSVYLANVHINSHDDDSDCSTYTKEANERNVCAAEIDKTSALSQMNSSFLKNSKRYKKSATAEESGRKFQRKSVSETCLQINKKNNKNYMSQVYITQHDRNIKKNVNANESPQFIRDSVTPPLNYNNMDTPKLHAELNKYGLKIQKRKRAVQLLTYIYNELHPAVPETANVESELSIISSEDDEPPMKKINHTNNDDDYQSQLVLSQEKDTRKPLTIIDEEKQFDDIEFTPMMESAQTIKDVFLKLLDVNKELHNKILAYEPLCINSLHTMLKTNGFKCKINTLMDFLDEQCITFYVQDEKQKKEK